MKEGGYFMKFEEFPFKEGDILKIGGNKKVEIIQVTGGGMGIVLICLLKEDMTPVILKTYKPKYSKEQKFVERFRWEAEIWVRLGFHRNIVKAFSVENIYGFTFVVAEYVYGVKDVGVSLRDWIIKGQINKNNIPLILNFAWQFCIGMIHAKKVFEKELQIPFVHRDIKPSNILINSDKVLKITDFGLVKAFGEVEKICGTPPYIAPEIWLGEAADELSDIYSFGCTLYEMIKGRHPFLAFSQDEYRNKHLYETPDLEEIPKDLKEIIIGCLEKDRTKRKSYFKNFEELAERIQEIYSKRTGLSLKEEKEELTKFAEYHSKAMGLLGLGYYREAIKYFDKAIEYFDEKNIEPSKLSLTYRGRARAYMELQEYQKALDDLNVAITLNPKDPVTYNNRGVVFFFMKKYDKAFEDYNKAKDLDPFYADVYSNLGHIFYLKGNQEEAIRNFFKALDLSPTKPEYVYNNLGAIYADRKEFQKALKYLKKSIEINPKYAEPYFTLGMIYIYKGEIEKAKEALKTFINNAPPHYDVWVEQAKQVLRFLEQDLNANNKEVIFDFVLIGKEEVCKSIVDELYTRGYSVLVIPPGQINPKDKELCVNHIKKVNKAIIILGLEALPQDKDIINAISEIKKQGKPSIFIPYPLILSSKSIVEEILKIT